MTVQIFTVFDAAAKAFLEPFNAPTIETAIRTFRSTVCQDGHMFNKYPEDYTLYHTGTFDLTTGVLTPLSTPHSLGLAITFLPTQTPTLEATKNA